MSKRTEYLITRYSRNCDVLDEVRAPKGVNIVLLLERLICRELDNETLIASCLRKNAKLAYDPFQIMDMRDELKREQAKAALAAQPDTDNPIGVYNNAREAPILQGKTLIVAGADYEFVVKEVEASPRRRMRSDTSSSEKVDAGEQPSNAMMGRVQQ
jgi:hypothetical protein